MQASEYLSVIRARKWLIILTASVVTLVAVTVSILQPSRYQGTATLLYTQRNTGTAVLGVSQPDRSNFPEIDLATQVGLIQQPEILQSAIDTLGLAVTPATFLRRLTVAADGQTQIITITALDSTPKGAASIADAVATAYAAWSRDMNQKSIDAAAAEVRRGLDSSALRITALEASAALRPSAALDAALKAVNGQYGTLSDQLQQLQVARDLETGSVSIVTSGVADPVPVSPKPVRDGALGLAVGVVLGLAMAFLANTLDATVKTPEEVSSLYGAPLMGQIPEDHPGKGGSSQATVLARPGSPAAEAYRGLRNNFEFVNFEHTIKTLMVTSATPGEGKSTVAANLAVVMAQAGWRVVLVVVDFRRSAAEGLFGLPRSPGLSEVLAGTRELQSTIRRTVVKDLRVLSSGDNPPNPSEMVGSAAMQRLLSDLGDSADLVILDTAPVLAVADTAAAARWADAALVVTREGETTREAARKAKEQLDRVGERVIGVVVTAVKDTGPTHGGYNLYSGYYGRE